MMIVNRILRPTWPQGFEGALMIGIDDVHPESSNEGHDCSGDIEGGVLELIEDFLKKYRKIPVTLYVTPDWMYKPILAPVWTGRFRSFLTRIVTHQINPASYTFKIFKNKWPKGQFRIDKDEYKLWRCNLRRIIDRYRVETGIHGLTHLGNTPPFHKEFQNLNYVQSLSRLRLAKQVFAKALPFDGGFAPPSYGINEEVVAALNEENFSYLIANANRHVEISEKATIDCRVFDIPAYYPTLISKELVNLPRNWNLGRSTIERALKIFCIRGLVGVSGHICQCYHGDWRLDDGITPVNLSRLGKLVDSLEGESIWFAHASEIAHYWKESENNYN